MPVSKPGTLPRWSEEAGGTQHNISPAPSSGRKDVGWLPDDEAIAQWFNWWMNLVYRWTAYLDDLENQALTWVGAQVFSTRATFNDGILVNAPSTSNRPGIDSTGNGTGPGVKGTAANNASSAGVQGVGTGSAPAGRFGTSGSGAGVKVVPTGSGIGIDLDASGGTGQALSVVGNSTLLAASFTSAGNAIGAQANASGSGAALVAINTGSGGGLIGDASTGSGYGVQLYGNATKAPLRITPLSSAPSSPLEGDAYVDSTTHKLRVYLNGSWVDQT